VFATILTYPFTVEGEFLPEGQAPNILARVSNIISPVTSSAFTVQESTLSSSSQTSLVTRFMTSMFAANQFLLNPNAQSCSIAAIAAELGVSTAIATSEYASAVNTVSGEVSPPLNDFTVSQTGIMNDVIVRQKFGGFPGVPSNFNFTAALEPGTGHLIVDTIRAAAVGAFDANPLLGNCTAGIQLTGSETCNGGTVAPGLSGNYLGLCSFACNHGYCPTGVCICTSEGTPVTPQFPAPSGCPIAGENDSYEGLCSFCCANGYCPPTACTPSCE
jgi:hypothetical protein